MNRLIAVVIALVLSACSYDPYHYYYKCTSTSPTRLSTTTNIPAIYLHNNVIKVYGKEHRLISEDDQHWVYSTGNSIGRDDGHGPFFIEKGTNRINGWDCTVEKTLFKK